MKKFFWIASLLVVFWSDSKAQLGPIGGELRYDYRYQDYQSGALLTKFVSHTPMLNLRTRGSLLSPQLFIYSLYSSLNINYASTSSSLFNYSGTQFTWNKYNLSLNVLPYSPVKLALAARENAYEIKSESDESVERIGDRQQEQRAELSVQQVPWLPSMSLSYVRNRSFATLGREYEFISQTLALTAASGNDTIGNYNISAVMSDFSEPASGAYDRFLTFQFSGTRALADNHEVNLNSEYNKYAGLSAINSSLGYTGVLTNKLRIMTGLTGSSAVAPYAQSLSFGITQSASYTIDENFHSSAGMSSFIGNSQRIGGKEQYKNWRGSVSLAHHRAVEGFNLSNTVSVGYSTQLTGSNFNSVTTSISNGLSRMVGSFSVNGNYIFSYSSVRSANVYEVFTNSAGISLSGTLPQKIQSQSEVRFRNDHYKGDEALYRNNGSLNLSQRFNSTFTSVIPLTVSVNGTANFYFRGITGRTYGWSLGLASTSFFLRGLSANYIFSKNYDPYYQREISDHSGSLSMNWRAIAISSRFRYSTFPVRVREIQVIVTRPF
ncbi:MAG: hypothetical protein EPO24_16205 [Bacteroidetes bacterium]|nr:MAG: hypothetical protein EPO24_16205 [Bacteroidota bacterium]